MFTTNGKFFWELLSFFETLQALSVFFSLAQKRQVLSTCCFIKASSPLFPPLGVGDVPSPPSYLTSVDISVVNLVGKINSSFSALLISHRPNSVTTTRTNRHYTICSNNVHKYSAIKPIWYSYTSCLWLN
mmetsp:Transcript_9969/g.14880  ORF Transcript_9969/g.14880 Transcript_9969/m.14880 type:complete len:130 (+) Transcript_9969:2522-2911(+)